ncbi:MXAN_6230/SCO0854 family RING domain-containing protein [Streptomyces sp. NPDC002685]|uniref:MXAN_6230/SCO0854 family RING domain-containing protein n=1 Tax=Streptomyces sp. NPDC002685 TaxID=3154540 RepID=UPI003326FC89
MALLSGTGAAGGANCVAAVLLRRRGAVYLPGWCAAEPTALTSAGATLVEGDLLERGFLVSAGLRRALAARSEESLAAAGRGLLEEIDAAGGTGPDLVPVFRGFPAAVPPNPRARWAERVLAVLARTPVQPCAVCGAVGAVDAVSPCAHLVCWKCFDRAGVPTCPVCRCRVDAGDPFLRPTAAAPSDAGHGSPQRRLRVLSLGGDLAARRAHAGAELSALLAHTAALGPQDTADLAVLLDAVGDRTDTAWLPDPIPARETRARVLAWLLDDPALFPTTLPAVGARITTPDDALRLLAVRAGGDPGLARVRRFTAVPRPLRRTLLAALDRMDPQPAAQDLRRRAGLWKRAAERLHPFEHATAFPRAALAFACLRGLTLADDRLAATLRTAAAGVPGADTTTGTVRIAPWAARLEAALAAADTGEALRLLDGRPDELLRRLNQLLLLARTAPAPVLAALEAAVPHAAPAALLSALGAVRARSLPVGNRVFLPQGAPGRVHLQPEHRAGLDWSAVRKPAEEIITAEVVCRAAALPQVGTAVIDAGLDGVVAPFARRRTSRPFRAPRTSGTPATLQRGSALPLPAGRALRLFVHLTGADATAGLDLAALFYNGVWDRVGACGWTGQTYPYRWGQDFPEAAVHSADLNVPRAPDGACEFVDLDLDGLAAAGVRYIVTTVDTRTVRFGNLAEAFAGLTVRDEIGDGLPFDARRAEHRFDLAGRAYQSMAMVVSIEDRTVLWLDVPPAPTDNSPHRCGDPLRNLGWEVTDVFNRVCIDLVPWVGLGEVAAWHAAARAHTVVVRHGDGTTTTYRRVHGDARWLALRITARAHDPRREGPPAEAADARLAFLVRGDLDLPAGSEVYALYPDDLDPARVRLLDAPDLVTSLTPLPGRPAHPADTTTPPTGPA